jgi:tyrosinase
MLDRRAFLLAGGASLAMAGVGAQGALAMRRSARGMSASDPDLAAMRRAVAAMKALPSSDPRNWMRFAAIHGEFCPHGNWYFLPWHRAYILAFERICRELSGKPDFALPYWDWTADRRFPRAFAEGDRNSNPLHHARPGVAQGLRLPDEMVGPRVIARIMRSPDFEAFGSTRPFGQNGVAPGWQRRAGAMTELEFNPHAGVHLRLGGDMAVVELSARDPIFFLHHANVDRLWSAWNRRGNANSPEPMWRDFAFDRQFVDGVGAPWNVTVGELGSTPALGYRYDDDDGPFAADVVLPAGDAATERLRAYRQFGAEAMACAREGRSEIPLRSGGAIRVALAENRQAAAIDRPIAIGVALGRPLGEIVNLSAMALRPDRPRAMRDRRHVFAVLRDIAPPRDATTRVHVFCNCRSLTARTRLDDPSYATSFNFFGRDHASHAAAAHRGHDGVSVCVDLAPVLARMDAKRVLHSDRLTVQLLPTCDSGDARASMVRPRCVEVAIV